MKMKMDEREVLENIPIGIVKARVGVKIEIFEANRYFYQMFGTESSDYQNGAFARFGEADRRMYEAYIRQRALDHEDIFLEYKTTHKETEQVVWVKLEAHYIGEEEQGDAKNALYLCSYFDITKQKQMAAEMDDMRSLYLRAISCSDEMIFDYLIDTDVFTYYKHVEENGKIINRPRVKENFLVDMGQKKDIYPDDLVYFYDLCRENLTHPFEVRVRRGNQLPGEYTRMRVHASLQKDEKGKPYRIIGTFRPVPLGENLNKDKDDVNTKDELTGLNTRKAAKKLIEESKANSSVAFPYALMILDIKDFRKVNDTYGHIFGDNVLIQVADLIIENINKSDVVARLGGDEFLIYTRNVGERAVFSMGDKLCRAIREIYVGDDLKIDACIGAVVSNDPSVAYEDLLQSADDALFELITSDRVGIQISKEIVTHNRGLRISYVADRNLRTEASGKEKRLSELIFELLEKAKDVDRAIATVLALVGEKKNLSRISVLRKLPDDLEVIYQWTARGIEAVPKLDGHTILDYQNRMRENFSEDGMGVIDERTVENYDGSKKSILLPAGCKSLMYCDMMEFGEQVGMISFADCTGKREWSDKDYKSFRTITRLISAYTVKAKAIKKEQAF
ncbi:MAG: diguanylate cyclase domain-containing protein [Lachnospiraceae bacterium]